MFGMVVMAVPSSLLPNWKGPCSMTMFLLLLVLTMAAAACVKAYYAATLASKDPEAFARWDQADNERRRHRREMLGKALVGGVNIIRGWFRKQTD
jgi:hypothetical protein